MIPSSVGLYCLHIKPKLWDDGNKPTAVMRNITHTYALNCQHTLTRHLPATASNTATRLGYSTANLYRISSTYHKIIRKSVINLFLLRIKYNIPWLFNNDIRTLLYQMSRIIKPCLFIQQQTTFGCDWALSLTDIDLRSQRVQGRTEITSAGDGTFGTSRRKADPT